MSETIIYNEINGYEIGTLKFDSDYNFFRDETCSDLNPCKIFFTETDRDTRKPFYKLEKVPLRFENGKMVVGALYVEEEGKSITIAKYSPNITYPIEFAEDSKLGKWEKYVTSCSKSIKVTYTNPLLDQDIMGKDDTCLTVRGLILSKMLEHIPDFHLCSTSSKNTFRVDEQSIERITLEDFEMYNILL